MLEKIYDVWSLTFKAADGSCQPQWNSLWENVPNVCEIGLLLPLLPEPLMPNSNAWGRAAPNGVFTYLEPEKTGSIKSFERLRRRISWRGR